MSNVKGQLDTATGQTTKKIEAAFELQETVVRYRSEQRRGLLGAFAHDADTVAQAKERIKVLGGQFRERIEGLGALLVTEKGRAMVAEIQQRESEWTSANDQVFGMIAKNENEPAWALAREKANPLIDRIDVLNNELLDQQRTFLEESRASADAAYNSTRLMLL